MIKNIFHKKLIITILIFVFIFIGINLVFGLIYNQIALNNDKICSNIFEQIFFAVMTWSTIGYNDGKPIQQMWFAISLHYLISSLIMPVISGIIFYYILNRPTKIIFPNNLIVRKRTSEGSSDVLTLSVKVGNKEKVKIYDVRCQLIYFYFKNNGELITRNGETNLLQEVSFIDKTFRFSFKLEDFPSTLLKALTNNDPLNKKGSISIIIYGKRGNFGDPFFIEKDYNITDIKIAKDTKLLYNYHLIKDKIIKTKINYNNLNKIIHYTDEEQANVETEIKKILKEIEKRESDRISKQKKK
ncbi:MAG: hypothetical protein A2X61_00805 [Ignavibacteria bacterium GWB2_35_12]|nr:MAG: hypothetical protein A2X61_00805 [Ignavibacteria bacterium GWB2_35_12]OGU87541.1 MAG: hypothetical protein A2220_15565 [Ignavibacteria bacterium RIFOXYA2_FULL_35_10]OGV21732.1 MAG: hypothetical protein A2475_04030 [Ignavibacteria bacterium RIFOXYC2_FULL_35_21]